MRYKEIKRIKLDYVRHTKEDVTFKIIGVADNNTIETVILKRWNSPIFYLVPMIEFIAKIDNKIFEPTHWNSRSSRLEPHPTIKTGRDSINGGVR